MARHAQPSRAIPIPVITAVVLAVVVLVVLLTPQLPKERVHRHDVRAPVPIPGRSFQPVPTEEAR